MDARRYQNPNYTEIDKLFSNKASLFDHYNTHFSTFMRVKSMYKKSLL